MAILPTTGRLSLERHDTKDTVPSGTILHGLEIIIAGTGEDRQRFESKSHSEDRSSLLLVRITIAELVNQGQLLNTLKGAPVRYGYSDFTCRIGFRVASHAMDRDDILGPHVMEWENFRAQVHVWQKSLRRTDGDRIGPGSSECLLSGVCWRAKRR